MILKSLVTKWCLKCLNLGGGKTATMLQLFVPQVFKSPTEVGICLQEMQITSIIILEVKEKSMNMFHIQMLNFLFFVLAHFQMFSPATAWQSGGVHCYITKSPNVCNLHPFPGSGSSIGCHWSRCARPDMWLNMPQGEGNVFQGVHL